MADYRPRVCRMAVYRLAKSRKENCCPSAPHGEIPPENSPQLAPARMLAQCACANGIAHIPAAARD